MKKRKLVKIILILVGVVLVGYLVSVLALDNTRKFFDDDAQITALPFVQLYDKVDSVDYGKNVISECPEFVRTKGIIVPLIHLTIQTGEGSNYTGGFCI